MSLQFACEQCGHPFDVEDKLAGKKGRCKHCGHIMPIPTESTPPSGGFKLRPITGIDEAHTRETQRTARPALQVRPLAAEDAAQVATHDQPPRDKAADRRPIQVLDPYKFFKKQAKRTHLNPHYETRIARFVARFLRNTRDRLYLVSLGLLVLALIAFLFKLRPVLHLAAVGVVATNIAMLVDGVLYLIVIPFRHSLAQGLGTVLIPPYALYYWWKHWDGMKKPLGTTIRSFTPIFLVGLAYVFYQESPVILEKVEAVDQVVGKAIGIESGPAAGPQPQRPSVANEAKQILGNESNIIQELAQPQ